jgi:hypothetical protein
MISANQLYKQSKSSLTFKEWLLQNQDKGLLDNHEKMYNLIDGDNEEIVDEEVVVETITKPTTKKSVSKLSMVNLVGIIGIGILIYGLTKSNNA